MCRVGWGGSIDRQRGRAGNAGIAPCTGQIDSKLNPAKKTMGRNTNERLVYFSGFAFFLLCWKRDTPSWGRPSYGRFWCWLPTLRIALDDFWFQTCTPCMRLAILCFPSHPSLFFLFSLSVVPYPSARDSQTTLKCTKLYGGGEREGKHVHESGLGLPDDNGWG